MSIEVDIWWNNLRRRTEWLPCSHTVIYPQSVQPVFTRVSIKDPVTKVHDSFIHKFWHSVGCRQCWHNVATAACPRSVRGAVCVMIGVNQLCPSHNSRCLLWYCDISPSLRQPCSAPGTHYVPETLKKLTIYETVLLFFAKIHSMILITLYFNYRTIVNKIIMFTSQ